MLVYFIGKDAEKVDKTPYAEQIESDDQNPYILKCDNAVEASWAVAECCLAAARDGDEILLVMLPVDGDTQTLTSLMRKSLHLYNMCDVAVDADWQHFEG